MNAIDAHAHVWDLDRVGYPWLGPQHGSINRTTRFAEIRTLMRDAGVGGAVLVQSADSFDDSEHLLEVARAHSEALGVVAWVPIDDPPMTRRLLASAAAQGPVVGVRTLLHTRPDPEWVLRGDVGAGLAEVARAGLPFDVVVSSLDGLSVLPTLARRHPELEIVLDHLGKPPILGTPDEKSRWRHLIAESAGERNVVAKLSGLYPPGVSRPAWTIDNIRPFVEDALDVFGANRLMMGGDWPICELAGGYQRVWSALMTFVESLAPAEAAALRRNTASRVYRLRTSGPDDGAT